MCVGAGMTGYVWVLTCDRVARNRSGKRTGDYEGRGQSGQSQWIKKPSHKKVRRCMRHSGKQGV